VKRLASILALTLLLALLPVGCDSNGGVEPGDPDPLELVSMTAGAEHSCGVDPDGKAYCWGNGEDGRLGNGNTLTKLTADPVLGPTGFAAVSAGRRHSCGVATDGGAYCWGFVAGRTQTHYPWNSWVKTRPGEPELWQHEILRPDGTAYDEAEVELIRSLTRPADCGSAPRASDSK